MIEQWNPLVEIWQLRFHRRTLHDFANPAASRGNVIWADLEEESEVRNTEQEKILFSGTVKGQFTRKTD